MNRLKEWFRKYYKMIFVPILALIFALLFMNLPYLRIGELLENLTMNLRFRVREAYDQPTDSRIVLVGVDQQSLNSIGKWPWPRTYWSSFFNLIAESKMNPKAVTLDVIFSDIDKSISGAAADNELGLAAGRLPVVIVGAITEPAYDDIKEQQVIEQRTQQELKDPGPTMPLTHVNGNPADITGSSIADLPVDPLRKNSFFAFVDDAPSDLDGTRRSIPMVVRVGNQIFASLSLETLIQVLRIDPDNVVLNVGSDITLTNNQGKKWVVPIRKDGQYIVNFRRQKGSNLNNVSMIGLGQSLDAHVNHNQPLDPSLDLNKKIVLIGETALGLTDIDPTPLEPATPLVYLHVNAIDNVLKNDYIWPVPTPFIAIGFLIVSWATLYFVEKAAAARAVAIPMSVAAIYVFAAFALFWWHSIQIDLVWPLLAYTGINFELNVRRWRADQRSKQEIRNLFSRMVAPEVLSQLLDQPEKLKLGGTTRQATVFFSDIRDFTTISESIGQEELVNQLNEYFERMVKCIKNRNGTFHKFIGDAIMSSWSAIEAVSRGVQEDAINAVLASIEMRRELKELNVERTKKGQLPLRIGIGLNHGPVLAGQIGANNSVMEFTLMGDTVNVASRLEGITKMFHTDMIIGDTLRDLVGDRIFARPVGLVVPKGKTKPMMIYEVLCESSQPGESVFPVTDLPKYQDALDLFYGKKFVESVTLFHELKEANPNDYCTQYYIEWIDRITAAPLPEEWDGRIELHSK